MSSLGDDELHALIKLLKSLEDDVSLQRRVLAGFWLTACTYRIVVLVMPLLVPPSWGRAGYLAIAETFAPAAECALFWIAFLRDDSGEAAPTRWSHARDSPGWHG